MTSPATYPDLAGRVALVTGGSRGIGAAIGRALAAQQRLAAMDRVQSCHARQLHRTSTCLPVGSPGTNNE